MTRAQELLEQFGRAELGIDGNAAFALLGEDIQSGEAEFVTIPDNWEELWRKDYTAAQLACAKTALKNLRERLGVDHLPYCFGPSHPYGG